MLFKIFLFLFTIYFVNASFIAEQFTGTQSYSVKGKLFCGEKPANDVRVKLIDIDFGPDPDDDLDSSYTNSTGDFELSGDTSEMTTIDPYLKIYHNCNNNFHLCKRKWVFELPNHYITGDKKPTKVYNFGSWNLEAIISEEETDCIP